MICIININFCFFFLHDFLKQNSHLLASARGTIQSSRGTRAHPAAIPTHLASQLHKLAELFYMKKCCKKHELCMKKYIYSQLS